MGLHRLLRASEVAEGQRVCKEVEGRTVSLLRARGRLYCIDSLCYHQGAPLGQQGDIEDVAGRIAITCPRHRHKLCLETGQRLDTDLQGCVTAQYGGETVQAVHHVIVDDGWIWVNVVSTGVRSDAYNCTGRVADPPTTSRPAEVRWGFSSNDALPIEQRELDDTAVFSQEGDPESLTQPNPASSPRTGSPPGALPCPLEPYGGWGVASLGGLPVAGAQPPLPASRREEAPAHRVHAPAPSGEQLQLTQMFRARSKAARQAVLRAKISAPTSYDEQHWRGQNGAGAPSSGLKRSARAAEMPSPIRPSGQRAALPGLADVAPGHPVRRGLDFSGMDIDF